MTKWVWFVKRSFGGERAVSVEKLEVLKVTKASYWVPPDRASGYSKIIRKADPFVFDNQEAAFEKARAFNKELIAKLGEKIDDLWKLDRDLDHWSNDDD